MAQQLEDGTDSGRVKDTVKRQVGWQQLGICAEPTCSERLEVQGTLVGECAHIIPKIVGSSKREDYATPLADRREEPNLLYLCKTHHDLVDDDQHAHTYTADVLRQWGKIIS